MEHRRTPGQRAGLTRDRVLAAARDLLAEQGLDALTMRALAQRLGVHPNTLYSHVEDKNAIIDEILDDVLSQVAAPAGDDVDPGSGLYAVMASTHAVLRAHPDLVPVFLARQGARGANAQRLGGVMLDLLERGGVSGQRALEGRRVLIVYTIGFAAFTVRPPLEPGDTARDELADNFGTGLRWLLAGMLTS